MCDELKIGNILIDSKSPVFIIAEAGVNHNGDVSLARELIIKAKAAGAQCVKFQTFKAERVVTKKAAKADYQIASCNCNESQLEMLKKLELSQDVFRELYEYCKKSDILFLSSPCDKEDVDFLDELGVVAFKVASFQIVEHELLKYIAMKQKPIILSTGMANLKEVEEAVNAIKSKGNNQIILMQCTTAYPSHIEDINLNAIKTMRDYFNLHIGYSDHTITDVCGIASVAIGARVIEKHFTLDRNMSGPDHLASADPKDFSCFVCKIRETEMSLGNGIKIPSDIEMCNALKMRRSLVAKEYIKAGKIILEKNIVSKRPATGITPNCINRVVGLVAKNDLNPDQVISWSDVEFI